MEHTLDFHINSLNKLCRACGERSMKSRKANQRRHLCVNFKSDLLLYHRINIDRDFEHQHSATLCSKCAYRIYDLRKAVNNKTLSVAIQVSSDSSHLWTAYDDNLSLEDCAACSKCFNQSFGVVKPRRSSTVPEDHEPLDITSSDLGGNGNETVTVSVLEPDTGDTTASTSTAALVVGEQTCQASTSRLDSSDMNISVSTPQATSTPKSKKTLVDSATSPFTSTQDYAIDLMLERPITQPLTRKEEKLATHTVRRKLITSEDKTKITYKTGGQPLVFQKITSYRKTSDLASSPTRKLRSNQLNRHRKVVAGTSRQSLEAQHASDFKRQPRVVRRNILAKSGIKEKVFVDAKFALAMKEALGLTWHQEKERRRLWKKVGVSIASEHQERKFFKEEVAESVTIDRITVPTDGKLGQSEKAEPVALVPDLEKFVKNLLDKLDAEGKLTWHENGIPEDEIWIKIGGDHGRGSLKICCELANTERPNSRDNTHIIGMVSVKDSYQVLSNIWAKLQKGIESLKEANWRNKKFCLFLFGDYDFFCKSFGLSGSNGTYPCLWCLITSNEMQERAGVALPRTLGMIKRDHNRFIKYGKGKIASAKRFHNCVRSPLLDIEPSQVVPPYLHILLGVTLRHHNMLEDSAHQLDCMLGKSLAKLDSYPPSKFTRDFEDYIKQEKLEENIRHLEGCIALGEMEGQAIGEYESQLKTCEDELASLGVKPLKRGQGPICSELDQILEKHNIVPQAYHSRSFIGNHCHKYMTKAVYTNLTKHIVSTAAQLTTDQAVLDQSVYVRTIFDALNEAFSVVHTLVSHTRKIDQSTLDTIRKAIASYISLYRRHSHNTITPKLHMLERHCLPFIERWGFGLGLLGEQGGEMMHANVAKIERRMIGMKDKSANLRAVVRAHRLQNTPSLKSMVAPPIKKRKH